MAKASGLLSGEIAPLILAGGLIYLGYKSDFFGKVGEGIKDIGTGLGGGLLGTGSGLGTGLGNIGTGLGGGLFGIGGGAGNLLSGTAPANIIQSLERDYQNPFVTSPEFSSVAQAIKAVKTDNSLKISGYSDVKPSTSKNVVSVSSVKLPNDPSFYKSTSAKTSSTTTAKTSITPATAIKAYTISAPSPITAITTAGKSIAKSLISSLTKKLKK